MELSMKDTMSMERNMDKVYFNGLTTQNILVISITIIFMEQVYILGVMDVNMRESGRIIKCMVKASSLGLMAENI
jgi:hypothetical protein